MRTFILIILLFFYCVVATLASNLDDATEIFNQYASFSNNYDEKLLNLYSPDAKIIREVVKPNGERIRVIVPTKKYFKELKIGQKTAKLKKYQNKFRNVKVEKLTKGIKISAERQPSNENYWLKMYQIVQDTNSGPKITEEMLQTKVQLFLYQKDKSNDE